MKPQTRGVIAHREAGQKWPAGADDVVRGVVALIEERLFYRVEMHWPKAGDYFVAAKIPAARQLEGLAFVVVLSKALPELWFTYGRLYLRGGEIFRRERGVKLWLSRASNVHLPREVRAVLRGHL